MTCKYTVTNIEEKFVTLKLTDFSINKYLSKI